MDGADNTKKIRKKNSKYFGDKLARVSASVKGRSDVTKIILSFYIFLIKVN